MVGRGHALTARQRAFPASFVTGPRGLLMQRQQVTRERIGRTGVSWIRDYCQ
jgi:hypothetical protein